MAEPPRDPRFPVYDEVKIAEFLRDCPADDLPTIPITNRSDMTPDPSSSRTSWSGGTPPNEVGHYQFQAGRCPMPGCDEWDVKVSWNVTDEDAHPGASWARVECRNCDLTFMMDVQLVPEDEKEEARAGGSAARVYYLKFSGWFNMAEDTHQLEFLRTYTATPRFGLDVDGKEIRDWYDALTTNNHLYRAWGGQMNPRAADYAYNRGLFKSHCPLFEKEKLKDLGHNSSQHQQSLDLSRFYTIGRQSNSPAE